MKSLKHHKYKNTGVLFELLVRQLTADTLNNTESKAGGIIKKAKTAEEAAWLFDEYYERSSGAHRQKRINNALALLSTSSTATA